MHVTEMSDDYNVQPEDFVKVGDVVSVKVLGVDGAKVKLSMKDKVDIKDVVEEVLRRWRPAASMDGCVQVQGHRRQFPDSSRRRRRDKEKPAAKKAEKADESSSAKPDGPT